MNRVDKDRWHLEMAHVVAKRSTCLRRQVGCVLVDRLGHVVATGYNGRPRGLPNCNDPGWSHAEGQPAHYPHACPGAAAPLDQPQSGGSGCEAVHAEQNALLQCGDVEQVAVAYVTISPCLVCVKLLMNTGCRRIVFSEPYVQDDAARSLWERAGLVWTHRPPAGPPIRVP